MKSVVLFACAVLAIYYFFALAVNKSAKGYNNKVTLPNSVLILIVALLVGIPASFIVSIPAQECGVVVTPAGVKPETYNTGWHFILPIYHVETMDKTAQVYTCASQTKVDRNSPEYNQYKASSTQSGTIWTPTVDGIKMGFDISASWRIDPEYAWWIYDNVSEQEGKSNGRFFWLEENVIKAKLKSALALTTSRYTPIEVYSNKREEIQQYTFEKMKKDIESYHLILEQIDIREVYYNEDYETAINQKKLEEQKALTLIEITKQKKELEAQALIDKNIAITQAQAEAEALKIKGQSISSNPKIVDLEWINKWDGKLPQYMLGDKNGVMLNLSK